MVDSIGEEGGWGMAQAAVGARGGWDESPQCRPWTGGCRVVRSAFATRQAKHICSDCTLQ
eukprot:320381-Prymnesium_polylepis.1